MTTQPQSQPLSERLKKVLEELESITRKIEEVELPSNDNSDDFLIR